MQRWGLSGLAAAVLEHGGAFGLLAAQSLHVAAPILEPWVARTSLQDLAAVIEDPTQRANLVRELNAAQ